MRFVAFRPGGGQVGANACSSSFLQALSRAQAARPDQIGHSARPIDSTAFSETGWKEPTSRASSKLCSRVIEAGTADQAWAQGFFSGKLTSPTLIFLISNYRTASSRPPDRLTNPPQLGRSGLLEIRGSRFPALAGSGRAITKRFGWGPRDCWRSSVVLGTVGGPLGWLAAWWPRLSAACSSGGHAGMRHDDRCFCTKPPARPLSTPPPPRYSVILRLP